MNVFDKEKAALWERQNRKAWGLILAVFLVSAFLCGLCIWLAASVGRLPCQCAATVFTAFFGCLSLVQLQQIRFRKRLLDFCRKDACRRDLAWIQAVEPYTTTIGGLPFVGLELLADGKEMTFFLLAYEDPQSYVGKSVSMTSRDHLIYSMEVVP